MFRSSVASILTLTLLLGGCANGKNGGPTNTPAVPQDVMNSIALCGAGVGNTLSASLAAKLSKNLEQDSSLSAELRQELKAAYFHGTDASNATANAAYEKYLGCIEKLRAAK